MTQQAPITKEQLSTNITDTQWVLRHFQGKCLDYNLKPGSGNFGPFTDVVFDFDAVKVEPGGSTIPYQLETGQIGIRHNDRSATVPWAYFAKSISDILGPGTMVSAIVGKTLMIDYQKRMGRKPGTDPATGAKIEGEWVDALIDCYVVISIDGVKAGTEGNPVAAPAVVADPDALLVELADGKDQAAFNAAAITNEQVKANGELFNRVATGGDATLAGLVAAGKLSKDEGGIFHKA